MKMIQKTQKQNKNSVISNFMLQILPDDKITKGMNSLNSKQRKIFNVVQTWAKDYAKYDKLNNK